MLFIYHNYRSYCIRLLVIPAVILTTSCKKLVTVDPPVTFVTADVVFANDKSASSAIAGLYASMIETDSYFANAGMTIYPGMSADEFTNTDGGSNTEFTTNSITVSNNIINTNMWRAAYNYIYQANAVIEGLNKTTAVSEPTKKQLTGEAKFIRAFCHFYLVNLFGPVPLITSTAYDRNSVLPRTQVDSIYMQVISDLIAARDAMNAAYVNGVSTRPNKWAATHLLARAYLYAKQYDKAEMAATEVISSGAYSLEQDISQTFLPASTEAIWQLASNTGNVNTYEGYNFIPAAGAIPNFAITPQLLNSFDSGDQRKVNWIGSDTVNGTTYYYPYKYKIQTATSVIENYVVLRYAELFLIRAEARVMQNNIQGATDDLNTIRVRAGVNPVLPANAATVQLQIEKERQVELFAEWGHRWFDLKRTNRADAVLDIVKAPNWQTTDALYPIPSSQLTANNRLTQNAGY